MTKTGIPFTQQPDGSWALPCGCVLHLYDGVEGPLAPHLHPCAIHAASFKVSREKPDARRVDP